MGWVVRFIHNRHLAIENLVAAITRKLLLSQAPAGVISLMLARMKSCGGSPPARSFLSDADEVNASIKSTAGLYLVAIVASRRNEKEVASPPNVVAALTELLKTTRGYTPRAARDTANSQETVSRMKAGVWINGDEWREDAFCLYLHKKKSGQSKQGVALVQSFYVFQIKTRKIVFVSVKKMKIVGKEGEVVICQSEHERVERVIHVDCLLNKMMCCKHWTNANLRCLMRTQSAML